jgi:hypothetical protein
VSGEEPLKILSVIVQNLVVRATQYPGFVHPWTTPSSESYVIVKYLPVPGILKKKKYSTLQAMRGIEVGAMNSDETCDSPGCYHATDFR